ncbi:lantibiotic dehydratase [Streptomyces sp. NPDC090442]|uniref:lantibiotic dehydratase n=1 Tax=Streptomyces sp. NPDC090442 TaxID=3365962 RepID=UPI003818FFE0
MIRRPPDAVGDRPLVGDAPPAETLGGTALLRLAGLPGEMWASAGNAPLFAHAADLADEGERQAARAGALGERLGAAVVPAPELPAAARGAVLALRRRLHAGFAPGSADDAVLATVAAVAPQLACELVELGEAAKRLGVARDRLVAGVAAERERVGRLALDLLHVDPVLRNHLAATAPRIAADFERRAAAGEPWHGKRLRKYSGYVWRVVARAAAKTTPRGWLGQLAAVPAGAPGGPAAGWGDSRPGAPGAPTSGAATLVGPFLEPSVRAGAFATTAMENVHLLWERLRTAEPVALGPATHLALTPLHSPMPTGLLRCAVVDTGPHCTRLRRVELRRTPVLDLVLAALAAGPRPLAEIEALLTVRLRPAADGAQGDAHRRAVAALRGLLAHLLQLGVLQRCAAPRLRHPAWTPAALLRTADDDPRTPANGNRRHPAHPPYQGAQDAQVGQEATWFVDSYRAVDTALDPVALARITRGLRFATRLSALRSADRPQAEAADPNWQPPAEALGVGPTPRSVADLLTATSDDPAEPTEPTGDPATGHATRRRYTGWHPAQSADSGYARLLAHLAARLDEERIDLDDALLDAWDAPAAEPPLLADWPADCLVRPLTTAGPVAVLESVSPAGVLDARFAEALHGLHAARNGSPDPVTHGGYPNPAAYRAFLTTVERAAGVRFVEVLVPPLAARAANAVRRPVLTNWCTGDPNLAMYYGSCGGAGVVGGPGGVPPVRHLPLDRITLRSEGGGFVAEAGGVRILPVHHATRTPAPPYDRLTRLLMTATHPAARHMVQLGGLIGAFPAAGRVPRLSVGGDLVVSPAQWRVRGGEFWPTDAPEADKVTALAALRRARRLPRFCFARTTPAGKPVPVDLAALPALRTLERLRAAAPDGALIVEEALPEPGRSPVRDAVHHGAPVAAQLHLRVPYDARPEELAARAAAPLRDWLAAPSPRSRPQTSPDARSGGQSPGRNGTPSQGGQPCPRPSN